ncbi:putative ribonuclease H-like domain-containing protein [Tanacetum coccineum]|uniref:Ribonuclease H-like domain-containing protein n=1 Tax=Tanacetum coccineum TaxID=301880 RepID=A0ABQ4ZRC0_9ASTR
MVLLRGGIEHNKAVNLFIKPHNKIPYELIRGRTPLIDFMKPFGCPVTILNTRDHLGKFDGKLIRVIILMDVKSAFLYGTIEKEVYVCQPPSFEDPQFPDKVYKVQVTPKMSHLPAVKRIFRYLKGQPKLGLWLSTIRRISNFLARVYFDGNEEADYSANSTTEVRVLCATANCCGHVQGFKKSMLDYLGSTFMNTNISLIEKCTIENTKFHQIVDFLSTCSINYALTIKSHRIYAFYIEQFWNTTTSKTVNLVKQIHAIVDGKVTTHAAKIPHWGCSDAQTSPETTSKTVLALEEAKTTQDKVITRLKLRVKRLEKKRKRIVEERVVGEKGDSTADQVSTARPRKLAQRLHEEELAELDRAQKERQNQEEATSAALVEEFDEIQARIDDDHWLRKKQLAVERAEAIRNKPPTRTQVRNMMITYLKHMGKYTHQQLKHKNFKEVQKLYEREKKWIDDFKPIDDDSQQQAESTKKRPRADSKEESSKKQKLEEDNDAEKRKHRDRYGCSSKD